MLEEMLTSASRMSNGYICIYQISSYIQLIQILEKIMKSDSHDLGGEESAQGVIIGSSFSDKAIRRNFIRKVGRALSGSPTDLNVKTRMCHPAEQALTF